MRLLLLLTLCALWLHASIGSVAALQGKAELQRGETRLNVVTGTELLEHDALQTFERSRLQLLLSDKTVITLGPNTHFSFEKYLFDGSGRSEAAMRMQRGFFRTITGEIGKVAPERFKIETKSATIGIRGTHFTGFVDPEEEIIGCIGGSITITTSKERFVLNPGEMLVLREGVWQRLPLRLERFRPVIRFDLLDSFEPAAQEGQTPGTRNDATTTPSAEESDRTATGRLVQTADEHLPSLVEEEVDIRKVLDEATTVQNHADSLREPFDIKNNYSVPEELPIPYDPEP